MNQRRYTGDGEHFRSDQRRARLPMDEILELTLVGLDAGTVLDVGCGPGFWSEEFARLGYEVIGVDINPAMVEKARTNVPAGRFHEAPMEQLPLEDDSVDVVFMGFVLHEADDYVKALSEARRVGRLRTVVLEHPPEQTEHGPPLSHRLTEEQVKQFADQAGYTQTKTTRLDQVILYRLGD